ncbi:hypothetical protein ACJIZ3_008308 [Penstemon smallii]|uniref:Bifunctional inhibitor/plant lipid transfer protein/seed storage helical domain-containing protein n=1 Tax=Penstemon smallii TaxID=265156 RepID=A0ABD3TB32_9LAMI
MAITLKIGAITLCLIFLCSILSAVCLDPECSVIPVRNLVACDDYYTGAPKPSHDCCNGVRSILHSTSPQIICRCYKATPWKFHFEFDEHKTLNFKSECGIYDGTISAFCCIFNKTC